jgi:hypothetical protein
MFVVNVWDGASIYYIDIFPKQYLIQVDRRLNKFGGGEQQQHKYNVKSKSDNVMKQKKNEWISYSYPT